MVTGYPIPPRFDGRRMPARRNRIEQSCAATELFARIKAVALPLEINRRYKGQGFRDRYT